MKITASVIIMPILIEVEALGGQEKFDRVPVVGDQKSMERGVEGQFSVRNAYTKSRRLEGLFFQLAAWHHENKFLSVSRGCMWCFNFLFQNIGIRYL